MTTVDPIVVTGMGVVSPLGSDTATYWQKLVAGESGVRPVTGIDTTGLRAHVAAEVIDFPTDAGPACEVGRPAVGRATRFALASARMAAAEARLAEAGYDPARVAVVMGTTLGEAPRAEQLFARSAHDARAPLDPAEFGFLPPGTMATAVAEALDVHGPCIVVATSCASGNHAIGHGLDLIRSGRVDAALVGGADALSKLAFVGFNRLRALASERCQPFDRERSGLVLGEGAAVLILERLSAARRRGVRPRGEVVACGLGFDAYHVAVPHPQGAGGEQAVRAALAAGEVAPEEVDYINAHGTGTVANDRAETVLVKRIFGKHAHRVPISSIKSMIGHAMGAASALEAVATLLALEHGTIPPTINYDTPDPECDLDYVPNEARAASLRVALSHAFAIGGDASVLLLRRAEDV